nr:adhesive plaque matrix protein 2 [Parasteatoda tepidariorum]
MFSCPLPERAKCVMIGDDDYYCECKGGYVPKEGEVKRNKQECTSGCDKHFCKEGSTCYPLGKDYWCICPPFFEGKNCTKESAYKCKDGDCPGANTKCAPDGNTYKCECLDGFELVDESKKNTMEAVCENCYCGQHSLSCSFDDVGNKKCMCIAGYAQRNITCAAMCRSNSDCLNGGICRYDGNGYFCSCKEHYKGDKCETNDVCDSMIEKCDAIGAVCTYNELLRKGFCECPPTRTFNRKRKICEDICKPGICVHGKCEVVDYHEKCRCYDGYEGDDCDQKISKITDKLEWSIVLALLIASLTCFITIILCFLRSRK